MSEFVSYKDIELAFEDFMKGKRSVTSAYGYAQIAPVDLDVLRQELNTHTYEISKSIAFGVTRPKPREIFAAATRDRIVHHLMVMRFMPMFEDAYIDNSYNCRKGKGTLYGVESVNKALAEQTENYAREAWVMKLDISGFFMSIDKDILWRKVRKALLGYCTMHGIDHIDDWLWLWKKVILHRPELWCEIHGDRRILDRLPDNKTLFRSNGKGLPIGNLTSQILANFYLSDFDHWAKDEMDKVNGFFGRYVDDLVFISRDKSSLLQLVKDARPRLDELGLPLNDRKFYLQRAHHSFSFIGYNFCNGRLYLNNRVVRSIVDKIRMAQEEDVASFVTSLNSYGGNLLRALSYGIRWRLYNMLPDWFGMYAYNVGMRKFRLKSKFNEYKQFIKNIRYERNHPKRRLRSNRAAQF